MEKYKGKIIYHLADKLLQILPDWCCGNTTVMNERYGNQYGQRDCEKVIYENRICTAKIYLLLILLLIVSLGIMLIGYSGEKGLLKEVIRPEYGENSRIEEIKAKVTYGKDSLEKEIRLKVYPRELTEKEKQKSLLSFKERLPTLILSENPDLKHVTTDLNLLKEDKETNIKVEWFSDSPDVLNENGKPDPIRAKQGKSVTLTAVLSLDGLKEEVSYSVTVLPIKEGNYIKVLENRLSKVIESLEQDTDSKRTLALPNRLGDGIEIQWKREKQSPIIEILCLFFFLFLVVFFKRYDRLEKELKHNKEAMIQDFPDFVDKLVLLLNAGMVTDTALSKISFDYERYRNQKKRPLYEGILEIEKRIKRTNAPLTKELREFAQKSGVRELMRFAAIVEDNIQKGSTLTEKLEGEAAILWLGKKKQAEEKGRLAETKLTFPLVLQLLVLILITTAPILMRI
ncbi:MAG: immunoglobulin-like domain-containing protein [Anaerovoracaceae bacterium]|jgi:tight adherence protein C